jgi:hypothetical protein
MTGVPVDSRELYQAVSYTWGDTNELEDVWVCNGRDLGRLQVRCNCGDVLQQLVHFQVHPAQLYWIDAICINQKDDREKGAQISTRSRSGPR